MNPFKFLRRPKSVKQSATSVTFVSNAGMPAWTPRRFDQLAEEGYNKNVVAYKCIRLIASSAASIPLLLFQGKDEIERHPALDLLGRPNPMDSGRGLLEAAYSFLNIAGNCYFEAAYPSGTTDPQKAPPTFLYTLRPDRMKVLVGRGVPSGYVYENEGKQLRFPVSPAGMSNIKHIKLFHPLSDWYGLSPLEAAAYSVDQHNAAGAWNYSLLKNSARPSGALIVEMTKDGRASITEAQFQSLKAELDERYSGPMNSGRPLMLEGGLKWQEMSLSPRDMDFINSKNTSAKDIALAFGVPPVLLGISGDSTYSNVSEANMALWEQTVIPTIDMMLDALNGWLLPLYGDKGLRLDFDRDNISALIPKREMYWKRINESTFLTDNEKRVALGYDEADWGNEPPTKPKDAPITATDPKTYKKELIARGYSEERAAKMALMVFDNANPEE